jgi:hypothetical protein
MRLFTIEYLVTSTNPDITDIHLKIEDPKSAQGPGADTTWTQATLAYDLGKTERTIPAMG